MNSKVTIITICYNAEKAIERTILSVLNQKYDNIEYIIIDGASKDSTMEIVDRYRDKIKKIISEPDKGIYNAMNKGLKMATGEWINFMNAGDEFYDENVLRSLFANKTYQDSTKVLYGKVMLCGEHECHEGEIFDLSLMTRFMPFCHQSSFVRNNDLQFNEKYRVGADYEMFYKIYMENGPSVFSYCDRIIASYECEEGVSIVNLKQCRKEWLDIRSGHKDLRWYFDYFKYFVKFEVLRLKK